MTEQKINEEINDNHENNDVNPNGDSSAKVVNEFKAKYEKIIEDKDKKIKDLEKINQELKRESETVIKNLNDEVQVKLEQSEQLIELNKQVEELVRDKAEATVDRYIQEGKILPAQKQTALKLCLNDNDTFLELYENAKPIVELGSERKSVPVKGDLKKLVSYFKD